MSDSELVLSTPPDRKSAIKEEQFLCNEALRTGDYDNFSEREWQILCENAHKKGRFACNKGMKSLGES